MLTDRVIQIVAENKVQSAIKAGEFDNLAVLGTPAALRQTLRSALVDPPEAEARGFAGASCGAIIELPIAPQNGDLPMSRETRPDPVIEYYKQFVDRAKLRANLKLNVDERLQKLQEMAAAADVKPRRLPGPDHPWEPVSDCGPHRTTDPIIELYKKDVDRTLLRENLKHTPEERLAKLEDFMRFMEEVRAAGKRLREIA